MKKIIWHFSKKTSIWIYRFFEAAVALFLVVFALAFWKLYTEPMDAKFLLPALSKELLPKDSGYSLEVQSAELSAEFDENGLFHLNMRDLQLVRPDKTVVIDLPVVELSYGFWHIVTLNYMPDKLIIERPDIHMVIDADGQWSLKKDIINAENDRATTSKPAISARQVLKHLLSFHNLAISHGVMLLEDLSTNEKLMLPQFDLYLYRRYGGLRHQARVLAVAQIDDNLIDIQMKATYGRISKNLTIEAGVTPVQITQFGRFSSLLTGIDLPVSVSVAAKFDTDRKYTHFLECLEKLKFQVKALQAGTVTLPSPIAAVYPVTELEINGAVSTGFKSLKVAQSKLALTDDITADVELTVKGLDDFVFNATPDALHTSFKASVYNVPMADVPKVWPSEQGSSAHEWVVNHLSEGRVTRADFNLTFVGSEMVDVLGDIHTEGVRVDYLPDMPALENVAAQVLLHPNSVEIFGEKGTAQNITLTDAALLFEPLDADVTDLYIQLDLNGPIAEMLQAINQQPLSLLEGLNFDWNQIQGEAQTRVQLKFPLDENLMTENLQVEVQAVTENAGVTLSNIPLVLNNGNFDLFVNNKYLELQGNVDFQDQPLFVSWYEDFDDSDGVNGSTYLAKGTVNVGTLKQLVPDLEKYVTGEISFDASLKCLAPERQWNGFVNFDAEKTQMKMHPVAFTKGKGEPAKLGVSLENVAMNFKTGKASFNLESTGQKNPAVIQGYFDWDKNWAIALDKVETKENNFQAYLGVQQDALTFNVQGKKWNLSQIAQTPFFEHEEGKTAETIKWRKDMLLTAQLDKLVLNPKKPIEKIIINAERKNALWKYFQTEAVVNVPFLLVYNPEKHFFEGLTDDFGALLSALNLSDQFLGGNLKLEATQDNAGIIQGKIFTGKTELIDPSFLMQALSVLGIVDAIRGKNMLLDEIHVPFELKPDGNLTLQEGYATGSNLGITFKGVVNLNNVDIAGSVIPAYFVNSLPGKIPLIGGLFRDGDGGGLLGVKYTITGKPTATQVEFHPLSSMAPGALGNIF